MHGLLPRRFLRRALAVWLSLGLAGAPLPALAQIDNLPRLGDAGADELSPSAERRLGDAIMREVRRDPAFSDDPEVTEYLNRLVAGLAQTPSAAGFSFELFLVRDPTLNAFAFPGGFIGVHSGLITAAQSESELASVLAHEMGHVTQRHIARMLSQQGRTSMLSMAAMVLAINDGTFLEWFRRTEELNGVDLTRALRTVILGGILAQPGAAAAPARRAKAVATPRRRATPTPRS
jgi:predicted Zn-dependent protease